MDPWLKAKQGQHPSACHNHSWPTKQRFHYLYMGLGWVSFSVGGERCGLFQVLLNHSELQVKREAVHKVPKINIKNPCFYKCWKEFSVCTGLGCSFLLSSIVLHFEFGWLLVAHQCLLRSTCTLLPFAASHIELPVRRSVVQEKLRGDSPRIAHLDWMKDPMLNGVAGSNKSCGKGGGEEI